MRSISDPCGPGSAYIRFQMSLLCIRHRPDLAQVIHSAEAPLPPGFTLQSAFDHMEALANTLARSFYFN